MCRIRVTIVAILLGFCTLAEIASAAEAEAWAALRAGRHVALMRHTDAPGSAGDPPGFRLDDCATQRNLSVKGRADAATIGARLKSEGIAVEKNPQLAVVSLHEHGHAAEAGTGRSRADIRPCGGAD
jgi:hypothetical protein